MAYRKKEGLEENYFGIGLTSRKNLCLHPVVSKERKGKVVDSKCRNMTASWVRSKAGKGRQGQEEGEAMDVDTNIELCDFYEVRPFGRVFGFNNVYLKFAFDSN